MRKVNRDDVLDELKFITNPTNKYRVSQRDIAMRLRLALEDHEFNPEEEIKKVIDILDGHDVTIPTGLKKLDRKIVLNRGRPVQEVKNHD